MAQTLGDIRPEDDYCHTPSGESNFNESMYFNFFETGPARGGFLRIGNRVHEGHAEVTVCLFRADGTALFLYQRPAIANNERFDAGGVRFEVLAPHERHRTTYAGELLDLRDPSVLLDPRRAFRESPRIAVEIDLEHQATGPVYGSRGEKRELHAQEQNFAKAHYEQHMQVRGEIRIGSERWAVDGGGLRDHSWGPRSWQSIQSYRWLNCWFGPDLGIQVTELVFDEKSALRSGVLVRGGAIETISGVELTSEYKGEQRFQQSLVAQLTTQAGERFELRGTVHGLVPLRNRKNGQTTQIGEGLTEYHCLGRRAFGISEYLDQVPPR